jgi:hypothetical protein
MINADDYVTSGDGRVRFGLKNIAALAADLRALAAALEAGDVNVSAIHTASKASPQDFSHSTLFLEYSRVRAAADPQP